MKIYTKFQKIQKYLSIVPYFSTLFIIIVTYIHLWRNKASKKEWIKFALIFFLSGAIIYIWNEFVMASGYPLLKVIASAVWLYMANLFFIELQANSVSSGNEQSQAPENKEINSNNKVITLVIVVLVICLVIGGFGFVLSKIVTTMNRHNEMTIPDSNGADDYSLAVLKQSDIVNTLSEYTMLNFGISRDGEQSLIDDKKLKKSDFDKVSMTTHDFSGVDVLQSTKTDKANLVLTLTSSIEAGNLEIVILVAGEYYCNVKTNQTEDVTLENVKNKTVLVKIAGESADFRIQVERKYE